MLTYSYFPKLQTSNTTKYNQLGRLAPLYPVTALSSYSSLFMMLGGSRGDEFDPYPIRCPYYYASAFFLISGWMRGDGNFTSYLLCTFSYELISRGVVDFLTLWSPEWEVGGEGGLGAGT